MKKKAKSQKNQGRDSKVGVVFEEVEEPDTSRLAGKVINEYLLLAQMEKQKSPEREAL